MRRNGQLSRVQAHFKRNRDREKIERALETLESLEDSINRLRLLPLEPQEQLQADAIHRWALRLRRNLT